MNLETYTRGQIARFAIEEGARHGGVNNMVAIAQVIRNRVFAGWGDWLEVVTRAPEKRAMEYPQESAHLMISTLRTSNVRLFLNRLDEIYTRSDLEDLTGGALFYMDPSYTLAKWFEEEVLKRPEDHQRCAHIGPIWFFK
jgi:hypothetical protein